METTLKLSLIGIITVFLCVVMEMINLFTPFKKLDKRIKQVVYGLVFGGLAVLGTEAGINIGGATINGRDAAVVSCSLLFGAPAGIIAGVIGGVERFFAVYWGAGMYTRVACCVSTILAGVISALLRKFMFDNKRPSIFYSLQIGFVCEVLHMLMIFITNMNDIARAFTFVKSCSIPMIIINGFAVMLSVLVIKFLNHERIFETKKKRKISVVFQFRLFITVVFAFIVTSVFTSLLQYNISNRNTHNLLTINIEDIENDIEDASDEYIISVTHKIAEDFVLLDQNSPTFNEELKQLCKKYYVTEISYINNLGKIAYSSNLDYIGFDMYSGDQSREFCVLLNGVKEFVQPYQPITYDNTIYMKYVGVALEDGFIQTGYGASDFHDDINKRVLNATNNRHIGNKGFLVITDNDGNLISSNNDICDTGFIYNFKLKEAKKDREIGELFSIVVDETKYYSMYDISEGYYICAFLPIEEADLNRDISIYLTVFIEVLVFSALFILIYFLIKIIILNNLQRVNKSLSLITNGHLDEVVDVNSNEEFADLSSDINKTVDTLKRYIDEAKKKIDQELEFAKEIQHSALPTIFPPFPERSEFDIFASMSPAKEVGGDFYDFFFVDVNRLAFLVADVSGKGIPASLFMMKSKTLIKSLGESGKDTSTILTYANDELCSNNEANMFVTCFLAIIDLETGVLDFSNAGHNAPLLRRANGEYEYIKERSGFVLAGMDGIHYRKSSITLNEGDEVFLYTDGVTEATNQELELFGEDRLQKVLNKQVYSSAYEICQSVRNGIDEFVKEADQFDDITMLSFIFKKKE